MRFRFAGTGRISRIVPRGSRRCECGECAGEIACSNPTVPTVRRIGNGLSRRLHTPMLDCRKRSYERESAAANDAMVSAGARSAWIGWRGFSVAKRKGHFVPIGSHGFYSKKTEKARFDQQPIEACAAVSACLQAYRATGKNRWRKEAWTAFNWFLGDNDLQIALYDPIDGRVSRRIASRPGE